jgi:hypothetical protein
MTDTRRLRELAVSFFAGDAWVKRSDVLAVLDTEGDRQTHMLTDDECPTCDRGLRGSSPTCIDCQLVEALREGR